MPSVIKTIICFGSKSTLETFTIEGRMHTHTWEGERLRCCGNFVDQKHFGSDHRTKEPTDRRDKKTINNRVMRQWNSVFISAWSCMFVVVAGMRWDEAGNCVWSDGRSCSVYEGKKAHQTFSTHAVNIYSDSDFLSKSV